MFYQVEKWSEVQFDLLIFFIGLGWKAKKGETTMKEKQLITIT